MQCQPCLSCYRQLDPVFNPRLSSSFAVVPCSSDTCGQLDEHSCRSEEDDACQYTYKYSGNGMTKGTLAIDKLAVGSDVFHGVVFGCSDTSAGGPPAQASGLVGLGRGPLSLPSQLSVHRFMYCLPPPTSRTPGKLVLGAGADAVLNVSDRVTITMSSSTRYPSYYYLNLDGIAVGDQTPRTLVRTTATPPPATDVGGSGANAYGMIVDIASTISFLEASLYEELADDLEQEIRLPRATPSRRLGLDLCFILPEGVGMDRVYVPTVSLSFDGRWLELERDRLFVEDGRMMCLMVGKTRGVSILGNFQQQNMHVLYNLRRGRITFAKGSCESMQ
ncbi:aspartyl protease 37 [Setaria italica]|nr:aspartyl protease 37 [Setaria italica]